MDARDILAEAGFRVLDVATADMDVDVLWRHGHELTLLFTEVGLQGALDGFALARRVISDHPHVSVVVASGHERPAPGELPDTACFIEKPFSAGISHEHLQRIMAEERKPAPP
ncbi:hypothetical protein [Methylobacterium sp. Leaf113]|uniref:hypothetical protein n=1 Tax=Methylobacterium sp. Leaf113 TaxID=1736259 RepID=UPI0009E78C29|nr:hypothetical protein [Methylobacterium sp. Leaf113]